MLTTLTKLADEFRGIQPWMQSDFRGLSVYSDFLQQLSRGILAMEEDTEGSMESLEKRTEVSEYGSSCEYESSEVTQFNEDGSFIGQYTTQKTKELEPDTTIPSAMSLLVWEQKHCSRKSVDLWIWIWIRIVGYNWYVYLGHWSIFWILMDIDPSSGYLFIFWISIHLLDIYLSSGYWSIFLILIHLMDIDQSSRYWSLIWTLIRLLNIDWLRLGFGAPSLDASCIRHRRNRSKTLQLQLLQTNRSQEETLS